VVVVNPEREQQFMDMMREIGPDIREEVPVFGRRGSIHLTPP
jgi:hypothetical protein